MMSQNVSMTKLQLLQEYLPFSRKFVSVRGSLFIVGGSLSASLKRPVNSASKTSNFIISRYTHFNLARFSCYPILASAEGTGAHYVQPRVSKRSDVDHSKKRRIALDEHKRLVAFFILAEYLTQLWKAKGYFLRNQI